MGVRATLAAIPQLLAMLNYVGGVQGRRGRYPPSCTVEEVHPAQSLPEGSSMEEAAGRGRGVAALLLPPPAPPSWWLQRDMAVAGREAAATASSTNATEARCAGDLHAGQGVGGVCVGGGPQNRKTLRPQDPKTLRP